LWASGGNCADEQPSITNFLARTHQKRANFDTHKMDEFDLYGDIQEQTHTKNIQKPQSNVADAGDAAYVFFSFIFSLRKLLFMFGICVLGAKVSLRCFKGQSLGQSNWPTFACTFM
jgi:hypothetical protein